MPFYGRKNLVFQRENEQIASPTVPEPEVPMKPGPPPEPKVLKLLKGNPGREGRA